MDKLLEISPIIPYIVLIIGFILLIKGADLFVDGCSSVAKLFHIPTIIIGLTIAAFGTSAPEAAVSITSSLKGANAMAVSNVIGSNIFNLLVVIGVCTIIRPISVSKDIVKRDFPVNIIVTILMLLLSVDFFRNGLKAGIDSRFDGILLLIVFVVYIVILVMNTLNSRKKDLANETQDNNNLSTLSIPKSLLFIIFGAAAIALGGDFVVDSASSIATSFNISQTLIGLTIVALGTSLPELVTSIVASSKGENDLAVGNVVGSNIFNILFVLGLSATVSPINLNTIANPLFTIYDTIILLIITLISYMFVLSKKVINRIEGFIMVIIYASYLVYIIIR